MAKEISKEISKVIEFTVVKDVPTVTGYYSGRVEARQLAKESTTAAEYVYGIKLTSPKGLAVIPWGYIAAYVPQGD